MINVSKCYRPNWDAIHTPMLHQLEGLCIDKNISVVNLKGTIEYLQHKNNYDAYYIFSDGYRSKMPLGYAFFSNIDEFFLEGESSELSCSILGEKEFNKSTIYAGVKYIVYKTKLDFELTRFSNTTGAWVDTRIINGITFKSKNNFSPVFGCNLPLNSHIDFNIEGRLLSENGVKIGIKAIF